MPCDLLIRLRALFRRNAVESELDQELRFHFEQQVEKYVQAGLPLPEARRRARLIFGGSDQIKEECREARGVHLLETLAQDIRYGLRMLRKSPGFTAVAVLTLALGIGANTSIFSLIDAVMLKQLPVKNPKQLFFLRAVTPKGSDGGFSYEEFEQVRNRSQSLAGLFAFDTTRLIVSIKGQSDFGWGQCVSGNFFSILGVTPTLGRAFTREDDRPGKPPVAVISYEYWKSTLASDPAVIGKTITLKTVPFSIIGVGPREFHGIELGDLVDIWVPMAYWQQLRLNDHTTVGIMARLKADATEGRAGAELSVLDRQVVSQITGSNPEAGSASGLLARRIELAPGGKGDFDLADSLLQELMILMAVVGLTLLIACANIANLLLARAANRAKEIALRLALGASRGRLVRQLLTEGLLLAVAGGGLGLLLSAWATDFLLRSVSVGFDPLALDLRADARVLCFTLGASVLTGIIFGLAPSFWASHVDPGPTLKAGPGDYGGLAPRHGLRESLVVAQVALSALLLAGSGLLIRSLQKLSRVDVGFHQENVLLASLYPTLGGYKGTSELNLYLALQERVGAIPGVESASFSRFSLLSGGRWIRTIADRRRGPSATIRVYCNPVAAQFFQTMGVPLVFGRGFTFADGASAPKVAVISEAFAREYFRNENPTRHSVEFIGEEGPVQAQVVGMVRDVRSMSLRQADTTPAVYIPLAQAPPDLLGQVTMEVRSEAQPADIVASVRRAMQAIDSNLPLVGVTTQVAQAESSLGDERSLATLSSLFGSLALLLTSIGLYGVMAYTVTRRTREIGIRLALGAHPRDLLRLVVEKGMRLTLVGAGLGLMAAVASARILSSQLYGISPNDPLTFVSVAILLTIVALAACYIPARRATRVDPMVALRHE